MLLMMMRFHWRGKGHSLNASSEHGNEWKISRRRSKIDLGISELSGETVQITEEVILWSSRRKALGWHRIWKIKQSRRSMSIVMRNHSEWSERDLTFSAGQVWDENESRFHSLDFLWIDSHLNASHCFTSEERKRFSSSTFLSLTRNQWRSKSFVLRFFSSQARRNQLAPMRIIKSSLTVNFSNSLCSVLCVEQVTMEFQRTISREDAQHRERKAQQRTLFSSLVSISKRNSP